MTPSLLDLEETDMDKTKHAYDAPTNRDGVNGDPSGPEPLDPKRLRHIPLMSRLSWLLVAGLIACGGFFAGTRTNAGGSSNASGFPSLPAGGLPAGFDPLALLGGGSSKSNAVLPASITSSGEIVLVTGGKIYVKMSDGTTKAVSLTSGTKISTAASIDASSLVVGSRVLIDGRAEKSGVIAANAVVLQPN